MMNLSAFSRRLVLLLGLVAAPLFLAGPAAAYTPEDAQQYVADNIHKGLDILNNKALPADQRRSQFEQFLLGLVSMNRIADFTLGNYRRSASPADLDAFHTAFQNYAVALYHSYFSKYAGQALKVTGVKTNGPDDFIVTTNLIDPKDRSGQPPAEVDFRVRTNTGKPEVIDVAYAGIWLTLEERDQFTAFLGQNGGNVRTLVANLDSMTKQIK
jgi:phospholipid transport system substrate-binding protein